MDKMYRTEGANTNSNLPVAMEHILHQARLFDKTSEKKTFNMFRALNHFIQQVISLKSLHNKSVRIVMRMVAIAIYLF